MVDVNLARAGVIRGLLMGSIHWDFLTSQFHTTLTQHLSATALQFGGWRLCWQVAWRLIPGPDSSPRYHTWAVLAPEAGKEREDRPTDNQPPQIHSNNGMGRKREGWEIHNWGREWHIVPQITLHNKKTNAYNKLGCDLEYQLRI